MSASSSQLIKASILSFFTALIIIGFTIIDGNVNFFLKLNHDLGNVGDFIFKYLTFLGDGWAWLPLAIYIIFYRRSFLIAAISSAAISTFISWFIKGTVLPTQPRPMQLIQDVKLVHTVPNVDIHYVGSFPSGHTTTAFCIYFLLCLVLPNKFVLWIGFITALLVGYSRVYQAQHFPIDVAGGIITAMISVWLSIWLQKKVSPKSF